MKGYTQTVGIDYEKTFAPITKMITICRIIALAAQFDWEIIQLDVKSVFLNGDLAKEVYMEQPPRFVEKGQEHLVCKLKKALYGLKQTPRAWYDKLDTHLKKNGFNRCESNPSL